MRLSWPLSFAVRNPSAPVDKVYDCQAIFSRPIVSTSRCPVLLARDLSGSKVLLPSFPGFGGPSQLVSFLPITSCLASMTGATKHAKLAFTLTYGLGRLGHRTAPPVAESDCGAHEVNAEGQTTSWRLSVGDPHLHSDFLNHYTHTHPATL